MHFHASGTSELAAFSEGVCGELGEGADGEGVDVGGGLELGGVGPPVVEVVVAVGTADDGPRELVRVRLVPVVPLGEAHAAVHVLLEPEHRHRRSAVVRLRRGLGSEPHHVRPGPRVAPKKVVHLPMHAYF